MRKLIFIAAALLASGAAAHANCVGTKSFSTCYDADTGNSYTVQRYGDSTYMNGNNARTGSNWSQSTQSYGNTTFQNGRDSRGNSWSTTCVGGYCN